MPFAQPSNFRRMSVHLYDIAVSLQAPSALEAQTCHIRVANYKAGHLR